METFEFILLVTAAILASSVIDQLLPRVSAPLVQIGLGVVITFFAWSPISTNFDPNYFLLFFIAPLLFHDAKEADRTALWKHRRSILSLAIGLVVAIMLIVGFALHWLVPSIPLVAAFALGAALGPTDAVAVTSLKRDVKMTRSEDALLSGESLINDATGVVAFQFAISAAVTGAYTIVSAAADFLMLFIGGIVVGLILAGIIHLTTKKARNMGLESQTFYVLTDLVTPFLVYLIAEMLHVSGILSVVTVGLILGALSDRRIGPSVARLNIVASSTWKVLTFILNGIVFVLLGMQLPIAFTTTWQTESGAFGGLYLIALILATTLVLVLVRFAWLTLTVHFAKDPDKGTCTKLDKRGMLSLLAMTIGGPKGAVTLSIMLSLPLLISSGDAFPARDFLIFISSGVILCTLLLANFILPIVSPVPHNKTKQEYENSADLRVEILRKVIRQLNAQMTPSNALATRAVIKMYNDRIKRVDGREESDEGIDLALAITIVRHQEEFVISLIDSGKVDSVTGYRFARHLDQKERILTHRRGIGRFFMNALRHLRISVSVIVKAIRETLPGVDETSRTAAMRELEIACYSDTIHFLEEMIAYEHPLFPPEIIGKTADRYSRHVMTVMQARPSITVITETTDEMDDIMRMAYHLELQEINELYEANTISRNLAKTLRENVHLMQLDLEDRL